MITTQNYTTLDNAYTYFNEKLFEGKLPDCIITFNRKKGTYGYFHAQKFRVRNGKESISEISLNPDGFIDREDVEVLSTLVHEMCHAWQCCFGDPPRKGYHDKEFARIMFNVGLQTSSTGYPDGKSIGQRMSHYILAGGAFEKAAGAFLLNAKLQIESLPEPEKEKKEKVKTREKFICPECHQAAWSKPSAKLACGNCKEIMVIEEEDEN